MDIEKALEEMENEEGLRFLEEQCKMIFIYKEKAGHNSQYELHEEVPAEIVKNGDNAILDYASKKIQEAKKEWERGKSIEANIKNMHIPIRTEYRDGTLLKGRIVEATDGYIKVELDGPLKGASEINFGRASAMKEHYVFTENHEISDAGYEAARRALCWAYEDAMNKPIKDLVERLNDGLKKGEVRY